MSSNPVKTFYMPHETGKQIGTIMSWPTKASVVDETDAYPPGDIRDTRSEVANIARAIAKYQPVHLFVRDPVVGEQPRSGIKDTNLSSAKKLVGEVKNITIHVTRNVYSLWARDTAPTFVKTRDGSLVENAWEENDDAGLGFQGKTTRGSTVALLLNYNQWGRKCIPNADMYFAATAAERLNVPGYLAPFIGEGGGVEVDGDGTMLVAEPSILNPNRNPGIEKSVMEGYFQQVFGVEKVIWIPGMRGMDITDDHIDALCRFARPGVVFVGKPFVEAGSDGKEELKGWKEIREILGKVTDAKGRKIEIIDVPEPDPARVLGKEYFPEVGPSVSYVNYLLVNGAVIMSSFGDQKADDLAKRIIGEQFPERKVEQVRLHELAAQGGGIHCATQQILG